MLELSIIEEGSGQSGHGGDLGAARRAFPAAPEPWLDLSTGINPYSYPVPALGKDVFTRLPEPEALLALEMAARRAYRAPDHCEVVAAAGSQALIGLLPRLFPARRVGVLGFTYSEHEASWRVAGAEVTSADDLAALERMDVAIVVNPNNPDGLLVPACDLWSLGKNLARRGGLLVVDEAFVDFLDFSASLVPILPEEGVVVLRSFGKAYGLPGLRLGFALTSVTLAGHFRKMLGPWPLSGAALEIGRRALADEAWLATVRRTLLGDAAALDDMLTAAGFSSCGGSLLYRLVAHPQAASVYEDLGRAGILVRRFAARPSWLRFGIPADDSEKMRLGAALAAVRAHRAISSEVDAGSRREIAKKKGMQSGFPTQRKPL
jgi:cobalamin biosynthetic protein CobC